MPDDTAHKPAQAPAVPKLAPEQRPTALLAYHKVRALQAYNQIDKAVDMPAMFSGVLGVEVSPDVTMTLNRLAVEDLMSRLWRRALQLSNTKLINARAMAQAIDETIPNQLLDNADVVLFPHHPELRQRVTEVHQDHVRDSAVHWQWIYTFVITLLKGDMPNYTVFHETDYRDLDVYAAEVLSEFMSVFAVGLLQAARDEAAGAKLEPKHLETAFDRFMAYQLGDEMRRLQLPTFSDATKARLTREHAGSAFTDVTKALGIKYVHHTVPKFQDNPNTLGVAIGFVGGGVSSADIDGDGYDDLFFVGDGGRLLRNDAGKRFVDVTAQAGLALRGEGRSANFADYDNDGDEDLLLTYMMSSNRLFENDGHGHFREVTKQVGLATTDEPTTGSVWVDYDGDGWLDLYLSMYGRWLTGTFPTIGVHNGNGDPNRLYHHVVEADGSHRFVDVTAQAGVGDTGWGLDVGAWDWDGDGDQDLYSVNDFGINMAYENLGGGHFASVGRTTGLDDAFHGMNLSLVDYGNDGRMDVYVSNIGTLTHRGRYRWPTDQTEILRSPALLQNLRVLETNVFMFNLGPSPSSKDGASGAVFTDIQGRVFEPTETEWSWDASFLDYDNDGDEDLLVLNGTVGDKQPGELGGDLYKRHPFVPAFAQSPNVFFVQEGGYFYDQSAESPLAYASNSRGSAFLDFDHDGDLDIAINDYRAPARVFRNDTPAGHHYIRVRTHGHRSNRDGFGAHVRLVTSAGDRHAIVVNSSGFLSQNPRTIHFGLGKLDHVEAIEVTWPSGIKQRIEAPAIDTLHEVEEPSS